MKFIYLFGRVTVKSAEYIKQRQKLWAKSRKMDLIGSAGERGEKAYTKDLNTNLIVPLSKAIRDEYQAADGGELKGKQPDKMQAVHSSSALAVNGFAHWHSTNKIELIAQALKIPTAGLTGMSFEKQLPIMDNVNRSEFPHDPNLDVFFSYKNYAVGVESKFSEAYSSRKHSGLRAPYINHREFWEGLPSLYKFAKSISPDDKDFHHLHPAQLIKHILGLRYAFGSKFRLVYLWYDAPFSDGTQHQREIERFSSILEKDKVGFQAITWQELIIRLAEKHQDETEHRDYIDYLVERYL